jgi:hypothetical protein
MITGHKQKGDRERINPWTENTCRLTRSSRAERGCQHVAKSVSQEMNQPLCHAERNRKQEHETQGEGRKQENQGLLIRGDKWGC